MMHSLSNLSPAANTPLILCDHCDLAVSITALPENHKASCPRCAHVLTRAFPNIVNRMLVFSLCALMCLAISMMFGFIEMSVQGQERRISLLGTSTRLFINKDWGLAIISFLVLIVIPTVFAGLLTYLSFSLKMGWASRSTVKLLRTISFISFWNMCEIYFLGILVSMVKIASLAHVSFGTAFFAYAFFIFFLLTAYMHFDKFQISEIIKMNMALRQTNAETSDARA